MSSPRQVKFEVERSQGQMVDLQNKVGDLKIGIQLSKPMIGVVCNEVCM